MSKQSPVSPRPRIDNHLHSKKAIHSKLKLKTSFTVKAVKTKSQKMRNSLIIHNDSPEDYMETLVSIEREYIKTLINFKKSRTCFIKKTKIKTPEPKQCKSFKRKKSPIIKLTHRRKVSSGRKYDSTCSSPKSDKLSKFPAKG